MTPRILFPVVAFALGAVALVAAGEAGQQSKEVEKALQQLNDAFVTRDADVLKKLMAEDHVSITPYKGKEGRAEQIGSLPNYKIEKYSTEGMKAQAVAKDAILLTYVVNYKGTYKGKALPARSIASSLWVMRDGRWREVFYQETPVGKE
jgi:ketosteroid isomerase-like protein